MAFPRAKPLDRLAEDAAEYDRIITPTPALADALNARAPGVRLGRWADTPRGIVYGQYPERALRDRKELYIHLLKETDLGHKPLLHGLETVLDGWEQTGTLRTILDYPHYDSPRFRTIVEELEETGSIFRAMETTDPDFPESVAVVAPDQLTGLDRGILPDRVDTIDRFTEDPLELPPFHLFESAGHLVDTLVDAVDSRSGAVGDVAVVLDRSGPYQRLLTSALNARGIPYARQQPLGEHPSVRTFLRLLRHAGVNHRLRVEDLRPILAHLGKSIPSQYDRRRLDSFTHESLEGIQPLLEAFDSASFEDALEAFREQDARHADREALEELRGLLEQFAFLEEPVTAETLSLFDLILSTFGEDLSEDPGRDELLLVNPGKTSTIDRSVVFLLGLDEDWAQEVPARPWRDPDEDRRRSIRSFQTLIQSGTRSYFFVQERYRNEDRSPCPYFQLHFEVEFSRFSDHESRRILLPDRAEEPGGFDPEPVDAEPEPVKALSQSALNTLVKSPRAYFFEQLVDTRDNRYLERGSLFHDFAEFYVNHPAFVRERELDPFVDLMAERMARYREPEETASLRTEYRLGLRMLINVLDHRGWEVFDPDGYASRSGDNVFAEHFDRPLEVPTSEAAFHNEKLAGKGKVDLIADPGHLMDFKSGRPQSRRSHLREASVERFTDDPDFQAPHYLAHHRMHYPDRPLAFSFVHFLDSIRDQMAGEADPEDTLLTLQFYPRSFREQIPRRETYESLIEGVAESNDRRRTLEGIGYGAYRTFFDAREFPGVHSKDEVVNSEFAGAFVAHCQETFKDTRYVRKGARSTLKELFDFRRENVFREDLDRYETFLVDQLEKLNRYLRGSFPVRGEVEDLDLDDREHRDLILDDRD